MIAARAAIYCRVSTSRQAAEDKVSLEDQEERCRRFCDARGWEIVDVYDEGDASAGSVHRGEFQRMITDARAGRFDVIVAREVSRLSRVAQARRLIDELMVEWGIKVANARTGMVYAEDDGLGAGVIWNLEARLAEAEHAEKSDRTRFGKLGKAKSGLYPSGAAPYGYRWSGGKDSRLELDPDRAPVVTRMFEMVAAGATVGQVADELTRLGVPTPRRGRRWQTSHIHKVIKSRAYVGDHQYGRTRYRRLNSERDRREWARQYRERTGLDPLRIPHRVREPGHEVYPVALPAIVDETLWQAANRRLQRIKSGKTAPKRVPMLQGLLRCEECGELMRSTWGTSRTGEPHYFYACTTHKRDRDRQPCRHSDRVAGVSINVPAATVEGHVWDRIDDMFANPDNVAAAIGAQLAHDDDMAPAMTDRIARADAALAKLRIAWDNTRRAHFAGDVGDVDYARDREHYEREITRLETELADLRARERQRERQSLERRHLMGYCDAWSAIRDELTEDEKRAIIWALVTDVSITAANLVTISGTLDTSSATFSDDGVMVGFEQNKSGSPNRGNIRTAWNSMLPFTLIAAGRESTVNGATAFLGMSHLNHPVQSLRGSAAVPIR